MRYAVPWALALLLGSCAPDTERRSAPSSVLLIVIDTLRADRLGCSGYEHAITPTLDSLAASGLRFTDANTPVPVTLPAVASLLTGLYPSHHGVRDNGTFALDVRIGTLAVRFRDAGFRTGAVLGSAVLAADRGLAHGFESYEADFQGPYVVYEESLKPYADEFASNRRRADAVTDRGLEALRGYGPDPFFLMVHYFDVHMQYDPPPRFGRLHPGRPYDGEVTFVDHEIGRLLGGLERPEDVLVIVVSDHGESQGEHGEPQHGFLLYQSTLQVPMIVSGPGVPVGSVRDETVSLVDLAPTLTAQFGLADAPSAPAPDGRELSWTEASLQTRDLYAETLRPLLSYGWSELRALRRGSRKLIRGPESDELYDLALDPGETTDLSNRKDATALAAALEDFLGDDDAESVLRASMNTDHAQSSELLESLGYLSGEPETSGPRPHPRDELPNWIAHQTAKGILRLATIRLFEGDVELADSLAHVALETKPGFARALAFLGYVQEQRGDETGATTRYRDALAADPENLQSHRGLARLADARGDTRTALTHWRTVADADSEDVDALRIVALRLLESPEPEQALAYLRVLVALDSSDVVAHFNLATAARTSGRTEEARRHYRAFLKLAPNDADTPLIREWVETGEWPE